MKFIKSIIWVELYILAVVLPLAVFNKWLLEGIFNLYLLFTIAWLSGFICRSLLEAMFNFQDRG